MLQSSFRVGSKFHFKCIFFQKMFATYNNSWETSLYWHNMLFCMYQIFDNTKNNFFSSSF